MNSPYVKSEVDIAYSREEAITNDALMSALAVPSESLRARGAAMPAPRFGAMKIEPRIQEVLDTGRHPGPNRRMDYSGATGSFSSGSRPSIGG
ncbi:MAG: hypothetical protein ABR616_15830 [Dermatophilaceae bacterium]